MIKNYWNRNISDNSERTSSKLQHFLEVGLHSFDIRAVFQAPEPAEKCPPAFFFGDFFSSELTASVIPWSLGHDWENFLSASLFQARKKPKLHDAMSEMYTHGRWGKPFFLFSFFVSKMCWVTALGDRLIVVEEHVLDAGSCFPGRLWKTSSSINMTLWCMVLLAGKALSATGNSALLQNRTEAA